MCVRVHAGRNAGSIDTGASRPRVGTVATAPVWRACRGMSHGRDTHAEHVQVLGTEGLCPGSPSGRLTRRAGDAPRGAYGRLKGR